MAEQDIVIRVRGVVAGFRDLTVLDHVDLDVYRGEILGFVGGSGAGKSVLMRTIIGLVPRRAGTIEVFGTDMIGASEDQRRAIERRWGAITSSFRFANISICRSGCSTRSRWRSSKWSGCMPTCATNSRPNCRAA
jgi:ABC-type transporter Mla maintaining outer membrane lipid asymmetry ATPase subunit MlaF